eukprot:m.10423 g.10423  ORF g.10423 m.10423 type:complete len:146 (-) comp4318_c0_seq1:121-558(-)
MVLPRSARTRSLAASGVRRAVAGLSPVLESLPFVPRYTTTPGAPTCPRASAINEIMLTLLRNMLLSHAEVPGATSGAVLVARLSSEVQLQPAGQNNFVWSERLHLFHAAGVFNGTLNLLAQITHNTFGMLLGSGSTFLGPGIPET